jgi:hypothetical protein
MIVIYIMGNIKMMLVNLTNWRYFQGQEVPCFFFEILLHSQAFISCDNSLPNYSDWSRPAEKSQTLISN